MNGPTPAEALVLSTADGLSLEAKLAAPADGPGQPSSVAVVCHPHPLYGGSMHNNVVDRLFVTLPVRGVPTLRFNFRGVGRSDGAHGGGEAERADVVAAIDAMTERHPGTPVLLAGYSFGADVALSVGDDRIGGWLAVSPPLRIADPSTMAAGTDARPTVIVSGTADDFRPAAQAGEVVASWPATTVLAAAGVDHFWMSGLDDLDDAVERLLGLVEASSG